MEEKKNIHAFLKLPKPDAPATKFVRLIDKLQGIREKCIKAIDSETALEAPLFEESRDEMVLSWASEHSDWNEDRGGLTLAEMVFGTLCHQSLAMHPEWLDTPKKYTDCVRCYAVMKRGELVDLEQFYRTVCVLMVVTLSDELDDVLQYVSDELEQSHHDEKIKKADWRSMCETEAGVCVRGIIPMASRYFWYNWCEELMTRGSTLVLEEDDEGKFDKWIDSRFNIQQQQSYRIKLSELIYRNAIPMGGHLFSKRGDATQDLPSATIARMELNDEQLTKLDADQLVAPSIINTDEKNAGHLIGKIHMFMYTFDNILRTSAKAMPFDPFVVWKSDIPKRINDVMTNTLDNLCKRPKRPILIQSQSGWFVQYLECTCEHKSILKHTLNSKSCVLQPHLISFGQRVTSALRFWCVVMKRDFNGLLPDGTSIVRFLNECL